MNTQISKLQQQNRELKQQTKESADEFKQGIDDGIASIGAKVTAMISLQAAVEFVANAYKEWLKTLDDLANRHQNFANSAAAILTGTGDLANQQLIQQRLEGVQGITREQGFQAFGAVSGGAPYAPLETRLQLAERVAQQAPTGENLDRLGGLAGQLATRFEGRSVDDTIDLATKLRSLPGGVADKLGSPEFLKSVEMLSNAGIVSQERGIALGMEAIGIGITPEVLIAATEKATDRKMQTVVAAKGQELTSEQEAYNRFVQAGERDRFSMLFEDKEASRAVLGQQGMKLSNFRMDRVNANTAAMMDAQTGNFAQQQLRDLVSGELGSAAYSEQQTEATKDQMGREIAKAAAERERAVKFLRASYESKGAMAKAGLETFLAYDRPFYAVGASDADTLFLGALDTNLVTGEEINKFYEQEFSSKRYIESRGNIVNDGVKELTNAINRSTSSRSVNLNQHTE